MRKPRRACAVCGVKVCADCRRERICCEVPRAEWPCWTTRAFKRGDPVAHTRDRDQRGTIVDAMPLGGYLVEWDRRGYGRTYVSVDEIVRREKKE